jgi:sugar transferase (PEP-CTERM/EpsH1 system associated)
MNEPPENWSPPRPRVLWLVPYFPDPSFGGGTRVFNLIKAIASTHDIDLIATDERARATSHAQLQDLCRTVHVLPRPTTSRIRKRLLQLRSLFSRRSAQFWLLYSRSVQDLISQVVSTEKYDFALIEHSFMGCYSVPDNIPQVLDQHNVESDILRQSSRYERSLVRRLYNRLEWWKFRNEEYEVCRRAVLTLVTSDSDRKTLEAWRSGPACEVIPNGVDTDYFSPTLERSSTETTDILFVGSMHYAPNAEAMLYFVENVWPLIQEQASSTTLTIVGGSPRREVQDLSNRRNISVLGWVPDVRVFLSGAKVVIAPLRIGGGTRLKILEAMAMGKPVVSTSLGCEGLDVRGGEHLLVADDPEQFANQVICLLQNPEPRSRIGAAARNLAVDSYDWKAIAPRFSTALNTVGGARLGRESTDECDATRAGHASA